jgi:TonB-linked SusC/RagA family outer membrane protein
MKQRSIGLALALWCAGVTSLAAQTRIITGKVMDSLSNDAVTSGQVSVNGSTLTGTIKDDGTFTLGVPSRDVVLSVRSIGFKRKEIPVPASQNAVQITLERDYFQLEAIVVTGQATGVERRNLANAVATVNAEEMTKTSNASIEQALQGKLSGASISSGGGGPGGGMQVQLRGTTSILGAYTPLYVIDGVIMSDAAISNGMNIITRSANINTVGIASDRDMPVNRVADLNPNDIESIEVLKGAAASAIYGSKASNGVILVTTKRGRVGTPQFSVTQSVGTSMLAKKIGYRRFESDTAAFNAFGPNGQTQWQPGAYYDHETELFGEKPISYETSASVSGGTDNTRYFASALVKDEGGIMLNTGAKKQALRLNMDQDVSTRFGFGLSAQAIHTWANRGLTGNDNSGTSAADAVHHTPSFFDLRQRPDGTWPVNPFVGSNPLQTQTLLKMDEDVWRTLLAGSGRLHLIKNNNQNLTLMANGGADVFNQGDFIYSPPELQYEPADGLAGTMANSGARSLNMNLNLNLIHTLTTSSLKATTSLGVQGESRELRITRDVTQNLIGSLENVQRGTAFRVEEQHERVKDAGMFAQEEVLIKEKLLLTAGLRADKSSNNQDPNKLFYYPKAAASYRMARPIPGLVDELKLRAAFGQSGNQPRYGNKFTELNGVNITGIPATVIRGVAAADNVRPERQREIELGADLQMLGSRVSLEVTGYDKRITDLLLQRTLVPSFGFTTQNLNGGVMRTRGLELGLTGVAIQTATLQWTARANFSMSRCKILELPVPAFRLSSLVAGSGQIEVGGSCTQVVGPDTLGAEPGDAALGTLGSKIFRKIGDRNPNFLAGLSNDIGVKSFHLYFLWDWRNGGVLGDGTIRHFEVTKNWQGYCGEKVGPAQECIGAYRNRVFYTGLTQRAYVRSTTYAKLREARVSWDLPRSLTAKIWNGMRFVRLNVSGRNLLTISKWLGYDPEINQTPASVAPAADLAPYPPSRTYWFSVDLGF